MELHHLPTASRLVALHDGLGPGGAASRDGLLRLLDAHAGQALFQAREVFYGYQLAACAPLDAQGHEILAASCKLSGESAVRALLWLRGCLSAAGTACEPGRAAWAKGHEPDAAQLCISAPGGRPAVPGA